MTRTAYRRLATVVLVAAAAGAVVAQLRRVETAIRAELRQHRAEADRRQDRLHRQAAQTGEQLAALRRAVDRLPAELAGRLSRRVYARVEAHADLRALVRPRAPMPPLDDWALDADILHVVASLLWQRRPELVVECGSGSSSVWLGYLVERLGTGRVVSLEHDDRYRRVSRDLVRAHGLPDRVEIRQAPLRPWSDPAGTAYQWYAPEALADLTEIGLLLVDGPPGTTGELARYPAGPLLLPRYAAESLIILDDTDRPDEQAISDRWLAEWPDLIRTVHRKGRAHVFTRTTDSKNDGSEID